MLIVGLTGNFGMGKSTVAEMFREQGAHTIDLDEIVRKLLYEPEVIDEIKKVFGDDIVEGDYINKQLLADAIFNYPHLRIALEDILHPKVFTYVEQEINELKKVGRINIVVIEAPVIFERGYQNRFDIIIAVHTTEEAAIERLNDKGISEEEARKRLKSQFPIEMKVAKSDYSIDNNGTVEDTREQARDIYQRLYEIDVRQGNN